MDGPDDAHRPDGWPEPAPPPPAVRLAILAVVGVVATGIAIYGAATADPESDGFVLFLGAAVVGAAVAIRQAASLFRDWRRHRDPRPETRDPRPVTRNPRPETRDP